MTASQYTASGAADTTAPLIDTAALAAALEESGSAITTFKEALLSANDRLAERFRENEPIDRLVHEQAAIVDSIILVAWRHFAGPLTDTRILVQD